jgi:hypothetical protein
MGGYETPPTSTLGSHSQRSASGTLSITDEMWLPQPHQEVFSRNIVSNAKSDFMSVLTACSAGGLSTHFEMGELKLLVCRVSE